MKTSCELLGKAVEEMNESSRLLSEASVLIMESLLRRKDMIPHRDKHVNMTSRLSRLREKIDKAARDLQKL